MDKTILVMLLFGGFLFAGGDAEVRPTSQPCSPIYQVLDNGIMLLQAPTAVELEIRWRMRELNEIYQEMSLLKQVPSDDFNAQLRMKSEWILHRADRLEHEVRLLMELHRTMCAPPSKAPPMPTAPTLGGGPLILAAIWPPGFFFSLTAPPSFLYHSLMAHRRPHYT